MSIVLTQSATAVSFPNGEISEASACNGPLERPKRPCLAAEPKAAKAVFNGGLMVF